MIVAVDYDGTFSAARNAWRRVIGVLRQNGAEVMCVTYRHPGHPIADFPGRVFYTAGQHKRSFMQAAGIEVDVWIDDEPELIGGQGV